MARISLRSRAWHGDADVELAVPDAWSVEVLPPEDGPELGEEELARALTRPIGSPSLEEAARGQGTALIVVDDLGRPTPAHRIVPHLLRMLAEAGVPEGGISFLVATGSHRPLTAEEKERKLGAEVCRRYPVHCHDAFGPDLRDLGRLGSGMPVVVNGRVVDAGLVIGVSCVLPHTMTGFSGGAKILLPGCAGILSIAELHSFEAKRPRGGAEPASRRPDAREVIEAFAERAGLDFSVNVVVNSRRQIAAVAAGGARAAHAAAVEQARRICRTGISEELRREADLVIANSYPLDADPVQVSKSQWPRRVFPGARLVLHDPACDGIAYHGWSEFQKASVANMLCGAIGQARTDGCCPWPVGALFGAAPLRGLGHRRLRREAERTDVSYRAYEEGRGTIRRNTAAKRVMARRGPLVLCSEGFPEWKQRIQFPKAGLYRSWEALAADLPAEGLRVAVLPCAPLQIPA